MCAHTCVHVNSLPGQALSICGLGPAGFTSTSRSKSTACPNSHLRRLDSLPLVLLLPIADGPYSSPGGGHFCPQFTGKETEAQRRQYLAQGYTVCDGPRI